MSIETVRLFLREKGFEDRIREFGVSSATVNLAAQAVGCEPARIAKTLSFLVDGRCVLIVAAGDAKIDNSKYKAQFHTKAKMLTPEQALDFTGHAVGGVCPFAVTRIGSPPTWMCLSSGLTPSTPPPAAPAPLCA